MKICVALNGIEFLVDDEDYNFVVSKNWTCSPNCYITTSIRGCPIPLARLLMACPRKMVVDHIDHNTLNNCKNNLRVCTRSQNGMNRLPTKEYKGVCWDKRRSRWVATIHKNYKSTYLGSYKSAEDAAIAYNTAALNIFGEFALLN